MKKTRRFREREKASARIEELQKDNLKLLNMLERRKVVNINDDIIITALQKERNELKLKVKEYEQVIDGLLKKLEAVVGSEAVEIGVDL